VVPASNFAALAAPLELSAQISAILSRILRRASPHQFRLWPEGAIQIRARTFSRSESKFDQAKIRLQEASHLIRPIAALIGLTRILSF